MTMPSNQPDQGETRELFRTQFKKTRPCSFFQQGRCRYGENCTFAHGSIENAPDLTKTSLCKRWKEGICPLPSEKCSFAHGKHELRMTPLFMRGKERSATTSTQKSNQRASKACQAVQKVPASFSMGIGSDKPQVTVPDGWDAVNNAVKRSPQSELPSAATLPVGPVQGPQSPYLLLDEPWSLVEAYLAALEPTLSALEPTKATLSALEPMKVTPSFSVGKVAPTSPISPSMKLQLWDHSESETAAGETSSEDGSHSSTTCAGWTPQHLPPAGLSALLGIPRTAW